jgi:fatty-acyl-CoA synthase
MATETGYEGVELRLLRGEVIDPVADRSEVERAVALCREAGLAVPALDTSCRFNWPDAAQRAREVATLRQWIALAHDLGVPVVRVFGGPDAPGRVDAAPAEADAWVADALREAAPDAEGAGVTVALETHDAFSSARRVAGVLDRVGSPAVAALWDSHHPYEMGESSDDVVAVLGLERIAFVHVKDARRTSSGGGWQLLPLGEGEVPVRELLDVLARRGYTGWISVEWEKKWHPELAEPEVALPQHIAWLRAAAPVAGGAAGSNGGTE